MQILSTALPGFRQIRAPLIAGYMWIVFAWIVIDPDLHTRPRPEVPRAIYDLGHDVGHVGLAISVSVVAYLIGAMSVGFFGDVGTFLNARALQIAAIKKNATRPPTNPAVRQIEQAALEFRLELLNARAERPTKKEIEDRKAVAIREAATELSLPATLLVGKEPELFSEVDRILSESELRLAITAPLLALVVLAAVQSSLWWLIGLMPTLEILGQGGELRNRSERLISSAVAKGVIRSTSLERFQEWVSDQRAKGQQGYRRAETIA